MPTLQYQIDVQTTIFKRIDENHIGNNDIFEDIYYICSLLNSIINLIKKRILKNIILVYKKPIVRIDRNQFK